LCPLPAIQPVYTHPYAVAKAVTTLAYLYGRRYLNMIAGGYTNDLLALNDLTLHDKRYARLIEYTMIIKELLASESPRPHSRNPFSVSRPEVRTSDSRPTNSDQFPPVPLKAVRPKESTPFSTGSSVLKRQSVQCGGRNGRQLFS
jgi:alkanesulfonate monooxygenase SsuD/methylene tetrahydromethanopterin reductase-like flavin-dependent oxidoreductase (luciferase family)